MHNKEDHDPLCGFYRESGEFDFVADACARCEFIAKVRADEQERILGEVNHQLDWLRRLTSNSIVQIRHLINTRVKDEE